MSAAGRIRRKSDPSTSVSYQLLIFSGSNSSHLTGDHLVSLFVIHRWPLAATNPRLIISKSANSFSNFSPNEGSARRNGAIVFQRTEEFINKTRIASWNFAKVRLPDKIHAGKVTTNHLYTSNQQNLTQTFLSYRKVKMNSNRLAKR